MKRKLFAVLCAAALLAGCGDPLKGGGEGGNRGEIIIGSSDVPENLVIAQLYATALTKGGARNVVIRPPVGGREVVVKALQDKSLSLTPDYSGNLLQYFDKPNQATESGQVYRELRKALPPSLDVLEQAPAEDKDVLVVKKETAGTGIRSLADLGPRCGDFVFGGPGQWPDRWEAKIKKRYGCTFRQLTTTDTGGPVTVAALKSGKAQVVDMFSTDSRIAANGFVPLADPKHMFPAQHIVPLAAKGALTEREQGILNRLSAALTTEKLAKLDDEYTVAKRDPVDIAEEFLRANNLM
ncbi:ABC transporter substrate-binding protein [Sciscionella sediminilitoris]|uniref:ABC transporter substrate-binding protein n=1 Tax=Sciscionella sediminilitoris TaxID=1445613 RepID=UPI0004DF204B|nr:ABC transporter substrate-binding protein [Sciscionella sp. SE31]